MPTLFSLPDFLPVECADDVDDDELVVAVELVPLVDNEELYRNI